MIPDVAGYFTPDAFRHAVAATSLGRLHEIFFNPIRGKGIDTLACFDAITKLAGFFTADDGYQHEIVATPDGTVHEIFFKPGEIHFTDPPIGRFANIVDVGAFHALDDDMRIVIVATNDGAIHEIFFHPSIGVHLVQPPLATFNNIVAIDAFYAQDDKMRIVIVATQDGHLHEIFYHPTIGVHVSQPPLANFPGIVGVGAFYAEDDKNRIVIAATEDGKLHEVFYHPTIGVHVTQPALIQFNQNITSIAAFYTPDDHFRHVIVATADGAVHEVFYHPSIGVHVSQPALGMFPLRPPTLEDISPDPSNLDPSALAAVNGGSDSTAGRVVSMACNGQTLYAFCQRAGVWKSIAGGAWSQLPNSPLTAEMFGPSPIAVDPANSAHVIIGNADGVWESTNGGFQWTRALDPVAHGWGNRTVHALSLGNDGTLYCGLDAGIARRPPNGAFALAAIGGRVTAFAIAETKVWARTDTSIMFSTNQGASWSTPVATPNDIAFGSNQVFSLGAFDDFAYMCFTLSNDAPNCGGTNWLLVFNAQNSQWARQRVMVGAVATCDGTGGEVDGRKFVKSFVRADNNLANTIGTRLQLFYGAAQAVYQAQGRNNDGTITSWTPIVGTQGPGFPNTDPVHADIWDMWLDVSVGGKTVWLAGDGGVFRNVLANPFQFPGSGWTIIVGGMHTHQVHTFTVLPTSPVARPRLIYSTSDNNTWYLDSTPVVMPAPQWQLDGTLGDANWTVGDAAAPRFALSVRHQESAVFIHYGGAPQVQSVTIVNFWKQRDNKGNVIIQGGHVTPSGPTMFQFIPSPADALHVTTVDAVMMVDLPLISYDKVNDKNVPFNSNSPLGKSTNGQPVLIRNQSFQTGPDMNTTMGAGWTIEIDAFPAGTQGFYVTGSRQAPQYYAFTNAGELLRRDNKMWTSVQKNLVNSVAFGPAFVNPYDANVIFALEANSVLRSSNGANSFFPDAALTALVAGTNGATPSSVAQVAFNRANPTEVVVGCANGLFFSNGGPWVDLTKFLPSPRSSITSVAIDCEALYVSTDARSVVRVVDYRSL
ncbi:hypothetical protein WL37_20490 [Burkholderia ubonensis]|nr:hypothetical protein WL37_20490 [Burkholderia ubonensis]